MNRRNFLKALGVTAVLPSFSLQGKSIDKKNNGLTVEQEKLLDNMENNLIYELQHIKSYCPIEEVKYFWDAEILEWIREGEEKYGAEEENHLLYASIQALEVVVKDIEDKRPRAVLLWERGIASTHKNLKQLLKDYKEILKERITEQNQQ